MKDAQEQLIERYLDGTLSAHERREFEQRVQSDSALMEIVERQQAIDASLKRLFQPPKAAGEAALSRSVAAGRPVYSLNGQADRSDNVSCDDYHQTRLRFFSRANRLRFAAALLLFLGGASFLLLRSGPGKVAPPPVVLVSVNRAYSDALAGGFAPEWVCETDQQFAMMLYHRLFQAMLLDETPPNVQILGWRYVYSLSPETMMLLTRVEDKPVAILIDQACHAGQAKFDSGEGVSLFRRQVGELVLLEVTPLDHPAVLEHFYQPEHIPDEWYKTAPYP